MQNPRRRWFDSLLDWYFVGVRGEGFIATRVRLNYAAPFSFLTLRDAFGMAVTCAGVALVAWQERRPSVAD